MATEKLLDLPCGLEHAGGLVERGAEIRKIKGRMQREVAALQAKKGRQRGQIVNTLLMSSLVRLGEHAPTLRTIRNLKIGDRDWLLYELYKHTWKSQVDLKHKCSQCEDEMLLPDFDLDSLPIRRIPDDAPWWNGREFVAGDRVATLPEDEKALLRCRCFVIESDEDSDFHYRGVFRYGDGNDQELLTPVAHKLVDAAWTLMSSTCLFWEDDEHKIGVVHKKGLSTEFWDDMDMDVLDDLQAKFVEKQPGVDTEVDIDGPCGHSEKAQVMISDFLFLGARKRR